MDQRRFDRLAALFGAATSRRAGLAAALGVLLGGAAAADAARRGHAGADARGKRPESEWSCGNTRCTQNTDCCTRLCDAQNRRCKCLKRGVACSSTRNCCNGLKCRDGVCSRPPRKVCNASTCANGCCNGPTCVTATSASACGIGGAACVACTSLAAFCSAGTCSAGTWANQTTFGSSGSGNDQFSNPRGIFISADTLTLWTADSFNNRISIWTRQDASSTCWTNQTTFGASGSSNDQVAYPHCVFVSADTLTVWVADTENNRISIWTRPDASSTSWSNQTTFGTKGSSNDQFENPSGIFVSADSLTAWVAESENNRISIWTRPDKNSTTWTNQTTFGTFGSNSDQFSYPYNLVVSADGLTAWVADRSNDRISIWTRPDKDSTAWSPSTQFGSGPANGDGSFDNPRGVVVSADSLTAWVGDSGNNRILVWTQS